MRDLITASPGQADSPRHSPNAALLIDFDNVTMGIRSDLQSQLRRLLDSEIIKGKVAVQVFAKYPSLRTERYWGNHFWASGYCVDTVGIDTEIIRKYVKYQEDK